MWPTPVTIATAIVEAAKLEGEDPVLIAEGALGSHARLYAFLALATQFKSVQRDKLAFKVGASGSYPTTARAIGNLSWFDLTKVNAVRRALGYIGDVTQQECVLATYSSRLLHAHKRKHKDKSFDSVIDGVVEKPAVLECEPPPPIVTKAVATMPSQTITVSRSPLTPRVTLSKEVLAACEIDRIPSRAEQLAGGRMIIVNVPGEPYFERSALAERLSNPLRVKEKEDGITLFTEGYNCGLHGDDEECPAYLSWKGKEYLDGWITGFNDRYLLKAPREEFDAAIKGEI